jgi:hypothetical protein
MRHLLLAVLGLVLLLPSPLGAQQPTPARHLVVLNKRGPEFEKRRAHPEEMRAHRQIYLDLTASGHIIASGLLDSEPAVGFALFREGVDEAAIKARLKNDFAIKSRILDLEYRYWTVQMGSLGRKGPEPQ